MECDAAQDGSDAYRLGEMNCSCVGFTSRLELAQPIADAVVAAVTQRRGGSGAAAGVACPEDTADAACLVVATAAAAANASA